MSVCIQYTRILWKESHYHTITDVIYILILYLYDCKNISAIILKAELFYPISYLFILICKTLLYEQIKTNMAVGILTWKKKRSSLFLLINNIVIVLRITINDIMIIDNNNIRVGILNCDILIGTYIVLWIRLGHYVQNLSLYGFNP